jgi:hypothetical protein
MVKSTVTIILSILFLSSSAAAAWTINDLDDPYSKDIISKGNQTVQVIEVLDNNDDPVNESGMSDHELEFLYNDTEGEDMEHLENGYWYAKFDAKHNLTDREIEYELIENSPSAEEINKTETLTSGNLTMNLETNLDTTFKANEETTVEVEIVDSYNGGIEEDATVDIYFTNGSWTSDPVELGYNSNRESYRSLVQVPSNYNSTYVSIINATVSGASYQNSEGSIASVTEVYPNEFGEITELSTDGSGCNNSSFFQSCERDTEIDVGFNVSLFSSSRTDLELYKVDEDDGEWVEHDTMSMTENSGIWEASFEYPDINTSQYDSKLVMRINSTIDGDIFTLTRNISSKSYKIRDKSEPTAYLGDNYQVKASFVKFHSLEPLNSSRFNEAFFTIRRPDDTVFENFTLSEMDYRESSGLFVNSVDIPVEAENGSYSTEMKAWNIYDHYKNLNSGFTVEDIQSTFEVNDSIEMDINKTKVYNTTLELEGKSDSDKVVTFEYHDDIENFTEVNDGEDIHINGSETVETEVEFNISYVDDYSGSIKFMDEDVSYNSTVDVELDAPVCDIRDEALCMQRNDEWVNITADERGYQTEYVELIYLGDEDGGFVSSDVSGDIFDYLSVDPFSFSVTHSQDIELNYSVEDRGEFLGEVNFTTSDDNGFITLGTKLDSNVEQRNASISVSGDTDLGEVQSGSDSSLTVQVENTGDVMVDSITASSPTYQVLATDQTISTGETADVDLDFTSVTAEEGEVTLDASTSEGTASDSITVTATVNEVEVDYESKISDLRGRINELSARASSNELTTQIEDLRLELSELRSQYEEGNIEAAEDRYDRMSSDLNEIEAEINSAEPNQDESGTDGQEGTQTEPTEPTEPSEPDQDGGGGIVIPLIVALLVILIAGFVVYTSYIPEEGDPLYSILGRE